jgi:hypothetical protein
VEDALRREEADKVRDDGRKHFAREIADRVDGLRDAVKSVKGDIMGKGTAPRIFPLSLLTKAPFRWFDSHIRDRQGNPECTGPARQL